MQNEMPAVGHSNYNANVMGLNQLAQANQAVGQMPLPVHESAPPRGKLIPLATPPKELPMTTRRLVQVFVVDPHEAVPLEDCLLYKGELQLTDATDQELFYEIDIRSILDAHNAKRSKLVDKKVKERTEYLEPARIRDLKMQIVEVARF